MAGGEAAAFFFAAAHNMAIHIRCFVIRVSLGGERLKAHAEEGGHGKIGFLRREKICGSGTWTRTTILSFKG
jgi:hypothetical protein